MAVPKVNKDACVGCEACVGACPVEVFTMVGGKADPTNADACVECGACVDACPVSCITLE